MSRYSVRAPAPIMILLSFVYFFSSCSVTTTDESIANLHCGSCHLSPSPSLLDSSTWAAGVLPEMKFRMGLDPSRLWKVSSAEIPTVSSAIPNMAITEEEWKHIERYYLENAPKTLTAPNLAIDGPIESFNIAHVNTTVPPLVTLLRYDEPLGRVIAGTRASKLYILDTGFSVTDSVRLTSPPSDYLAINPDSMHILQMGKMDPNDLSNGSLIAYGKSNQRGAILIDSLKRPVHMAHSDFDLDGDNDILISCFGNFTGGLLLCENRNGRFIKHVIHQLPGTRKTILRDVNGDGLMDFFALITQGDEQITLFTNQDNFTFSPRVLLRFPPVYGSSYFDLVDTNNDGEEDILYCNGDNADFSNIVKPYHGIRVYRNTGDYNFKEEFFLPLPGASQAFARDFDGDGDTDIAAITYFPDFSVHPQQSFVYFENSGNAFLRRATPLFDKGRWLVMEAGDFDKDNDDDIMLGALNLRFGTPDSVFLRWRDEPLSLLLLKNSRN